MRGSGAFMLAGVGRESYSLMDDRSWTPCNRTSYNLNGWQSDTQQLIVSTSDPLRPDLS